MHKYIFTWNHNVKNKIKIYCCTYILYSIFTFLKNKNITHYYLKYLHLLIKMYSIIFRMIDVAQVTLKSNMNILRTI